MPPQVTAPAVGKLPKSWAVDVLRWPEPCISRDPMRDQFRNSPSAGFSLVEMLMVVSMIALLSLFAFPKVIRGFDQSQVKSARLAVLNKFASARIQARQSSRTR